MDIEVLDQILDNIEQYEFDVDQINKQKKFNVTKSFNMKSKHTKYSTATLPFDFT